MKGRSGASGGSPALLATALALVLGGTAAIAAGCSGTGQESGADPRKALLVRQLIGDEAGPFGRPYDLGIVGDSVVVLDRRPLRGDDRILVIDQDTGRIVETAAPPGEGPTDLQQAQSVQPDEGDASRFWVQDNGNARMALYDLDSLAQGAIDLVQFSGSPYQAQWSGDSLFTTGLSATELVQRHLRDGRVARLAQRIGDPLFPDAFPDAPWGAAAHVNRNKLALHPAGDRFVLAFTFLDRIQVYDRGGTLLHDVTGPGGVVPDADEGYQEWEPRYREVRATEGLVLALLAEPEAETGAAAGTGSEGSGAGAADPAASSSEGPAHVYRTLHVYTWEGDLIAIRDLERSVVRFAIDGSTGTIWGLTRDPPALIEFESIR